ncbi:MAG: hypothetical protein AAGG47_18200 [Pseudomonadota bacterium]
MELLNTLQDRFGPRIKAVAMLLITAVGGSVVTSATELQTILVELIQFVGGEGMAAAIGGITTAFAIAVSWFDRNLNVGEGVGAKEVREEMEAAAREAAEQ